MLYDTASLPTEILDAFGGPTSYPAVDSGLSFRPEISAPKPAF